MKDTDPNYRPRNLCRGCDQDFAGVTLFEAHRVGEHRTGRRCLTVAEMTALGWRDVAGYWRGLPLPVGTFPARVGP